MRTLLIYASFSVPILLSVILLGGVYSTWNYNTYIITGTSLIYVLYSIHLLHDRKRLFIPGIIIPFAALVVYSLLQLIPLPLSVIEILSPRAHYFYNIESNGSFFPLSLSPVETFYSILRLLSLIFFSVMLQRTISGGRKSWKNRVIKMIIVTGTSMAIIGILLNIARIDTWLGHKLTGLLLIQTPFINPNHAGSFFGITTLFSLIFLLKQDVGRERLLYGAHFFINLVSLINTLSRGAIVACILAIFFYIFIYFLKKRHIRLLLPILFFIIAVSTAFYASYAVIIDEFQFDNQNYFDKIDIVMETAQLFINDFFLTGAGLGSFMHVFPFYQDNPEFFFLQLENEFLQFIFETGLIFSLFFTLLMIYVLVKKNSSKNNNTAPFAVILFFILLHNSVDFNLHNMSTLFLLCSTLVFMNYSFELKRFHRKFFLLSTSVVSCFVMYTAITYDHFDFFKNKESLPYNKLLQYYPSDYKIPMEQSIQLINNKNTSIFLSAAPYISAAISKAPDYYFNYFLMGNYLLRIGSFEESAEMYERAVVRSGPKAGNILKSIYNNLKKTKQLSLLKEIIPFDDTSFTPAVHSLLSTVRHHDRKFLESLIKGRETQYFQHAAMVLLAEKNFVELKQLIESLQSSYNSFSDQEKGSYFKYSGHIKLYEKQINQALDFFWKGATLTENFSDWMQLAYLFLKHGRIKEIDKIDQQLRDKALSNKNQLIQYYRWRSRVYERQGNITKMFSTLEKAANLSSAPSTRLHIAKTYFKYKQYEKAIEEISFLQQQYPEYNPEHIRKIKNNFKKTLKQKNDTLIKNMFIEEYNKDHEKN